MIRTEERAGNRRNTDQTERADGFISADELLIRAWRSGFVFRDFRKKKVSRNLSAAVRKGRNTLCVFGVTVDGCSHCFLQTWTCICWRNRGWSARRGSWSLTSNRSSCELRAHKPIQRLTQLLRNKLQMMQQEQKVKPEKVKPGTHAWWWKSRHAGWSPATSQRPAGQEGRLCYRPSNVCWVKKATVLLHFNM